MPARSTWYPAAVATPLGQVPHLALVRPWRLGHETILHGLVPWRRDTLRCHTSITGQFRARLRMITMWWVIRPEPPSFIWTCSKKCRICQECASV